MGKKLLISESEKNNILKMYGLITEQVLKRISIQGKQPVNNTDWDLVHGILGSKRIDDDLEKRVGDELKNGNYRVQKVYVTSKKVGNEIVTDAAVDLGGTYNNQLPHKAFTTRGSIGSDYENRHDLQVNGLEGKLQSYYNGNVMTFGPYIITVDGTNVKYKQSFYAIEGQPSGINTNQTGIPTNNNQNQQNQSSQQQTTQISNQQPIDITANNLEDFKNQIREKTYNKSIDKGSISFDMDNFKLNIKPGNQKIIRLTLTFNTPDEHKQKKFPSKDAVITANSKDYNVETINSGLFENNTRDFALIIISQKTQ